MPYVKSVTSESPANQWNVKSEKSQCNAGASVENLKSNGSKCEQEIAKSANAARSQGNGTIRNVNRNQRRMSA
jgi:hypothetical protein